MVSLRKLFEKFVEKICLFRVTVSVMFWVHVGCRESNPLMSLRMSEHVVI